MRFEAWVLRIEPLGYDVTHNMPVNISQAEVTSGIAIGQLFVINPQQMQDRGMKIMHMHRILRRVHSEFVGSAINRPPFDSTSRHQ